MREANFFRPARRRVNRRGADAGMAKPALGKIERYSRLQRTNPERMA
jgi:hypothetical protein